MNEKGARPYFCISINRVKKKPKQFIDHRNSATMKNYSDMVGVPFLLFY